VVDTPAIGRKDRFRFVWFGVSAILLGVIGLLIWAHSTSRPPDHKQAIRAAAIARAQRAHRPRLHLIVDDYLKAQGFFLKGRSLPGGDFHPYDDLYASDAHWPYAAQLFEFTGNCGTLVNPNLSGLTATANVLGRVVASERSGAEFLPSGYVFRAPAQAAKAQALETAPNYVPCEVELIKERLDNASSFYIGGVKYTITRQTQHVIARTIDGVLVRGQQVVLDVTNKPKFVASFPESLETSFIFFRYGRALFELRTSTPWAGQSVNAAAVRRDWQNAIDATARRLKRSGF
jgi:hypothetical protein